MQAFLIFALLVCCTVSAADITAVINGQKISYPNQIATLKADESVEIAVNVGGLNEVPDQAVVEFSTAASDDAYFALLQKKEALHVFVDVKKDLETPCQHLKSEAVEYTVTLYISDDKLEKPVQWKLGVVRVVVEANQALQQKCDHSEEQMWKARKEFTHQFRPPAPRAPAVIALVFVGILVVVPNSILLRLTSYLGVTASALGSLFTPFIIMLSAEMGVVVIYWLDVLKLFPTLALMCILGVAATAVRPRPPTGDSVSVSRKKNE